MSRKKHEEAEQPTEEMAREYGDAPVHEGEEVPGAIVIPPEDTGHGEPPGPEDPEEPETEPAEGTEDEDLVPLEEEE